MVIAIDNFFGCYLLYCTDKKYKGRTYIGFTVNPERRITQHNAGKHKGGAWKTSGKEWHMTLIVHGFPSDISALRFEWAWQNPTVSRRLKHVSGKSRKETSYQYRVRVMANMLCVSPWKLLPLTVRWLKQEYYIDLNPSSPTHIPIAYGPVTAKVKKHKQIQNKEKVAEIKPESSSDNDSDSSTECMTLMQRLTQKSVPKPKPNKHICSVCNFSIIGDNNLQCLNENCTMVSHLICLSKQFLKNQDKFQIIPVEGKCPKCNILFLWGDVIRHNQGFHQYFNP